MLKKLLRGPYSEPRQAGFAPGGFAHPCSNQFCNKPDFLTKPSGFIKILVQNQFQINIFLNLVKKKLIGVNEAVRKRYLREKIN